MFVVRATLYLFERGELMNHVMRIIALSMLIPVQIMGFFGPSMRMLVQKSDDNISRELVVSILKRSTGETYSTTTVKDGKTLLAKKVKLPISSKNSIDQALVDLKDYDIQVEDKKEGSGRIVPLDYLLEQTKTSVVPAYRKLDKLLIYVNRYNEPSFRRINIPL